MIKLLFIEGMKNSTLHDKSFLITVQGLKQNDYKDNFPKS